MGHAKRIEEFNHDLLKFPPLMWVCLLIICCIELMYFILLLVFVRWYRISYKLR